MCVCGNSSKRMTIAVKWEKAIVFAFLSFPEDIFERNKETFDIRIHKEEQKTKEASFFAASSFCFFQQNENFLHETFYVRLKKSWKRGLTWRARVASGSFV